MAIIETCKLSRSYNGTLALTDLDLKVEQGEVMGFLGPNGAGKTTTIRLLAGMIGPTSGYAVVDTLRPDREPEKVHEVVGLLTETPGFYNRLSAVRNLEFFAGFYPGTRAGANIERYLKAMGLWERRDDRVGGFSKGMKQRLALARALIHEPKILFLDEPTAGLDPEAAGEVRTLIRRLGEAGRTIIISTHNLAEAEQLCQRIAVIRTRLLALDTPEKLRLRYFRRQVVIELDYIDEKVAAAVQKLPFVQSMRMENNRLFLEMADAEQNRPEVVRAIVGAGGRIRAVTGEEHPLEEVYLKLIHEEEKP